MAWFRLGGAGISAALKNAMTAVLNKKLGTSQEYAPNAWPEEVNLLGALEEKTASGSIVTFSDGADDVPLKSCEVALPPSLDGYSSVDVVHYGKNILNGEDAVKTANNIRFYYANGKYYLAGTYTLSINESVSGLYVRNISTSTNIATKYNSNFITFTLTEKTLIGFDFYKVGINQDDNVMLEVGSTATAYEPYSAPTTHTAQLGRTIYGGSVDVVKGEGQESYGKKVFDGTEGTGGTPSWTMISVTQGTMFRITVSDKATTSATNTLCSYYTPVAQAQRADGTVSGAGTNVDIIDNRFSSVDDFKEWLVENPVTLVYELATQTDFTFEPVEINSQLGDNTMWSDGDMSVVYRASGTMTPIQPTLISKTITANGTYIASDDDVDGYDTVEVSVPSPEPTVTPLNSPNAFLSQSGVSGTDVTRTVRTETAPSDGKYVFASDSTCKTNTGSGDGFIDIQKNGVSVVKQYMEANTTTSITIPDIEVVTGDEVYFVVGFDNAHSSCNFQLYTGIAFVSEASSLLSMSNSNSTNELENELNNLDESEAEQNEELI